MNFGSGISRTGEAARLASSGGSSANDPCLVVAFVSTPGLGKTSICEALQQHLDPARYHVVHHHSDALAMPQRKRFWPYVNTLALTRRGDGRATLVLADKNLLDSPPGNWEKTAAQINAPVLAVLLTDAASAAPLASHETLSPGAGGTDPAAQTAAPSAPRSADAAAAAVALAEEGLGKLDMNSSRTGRAAWKVGKGDGPAGQGGAGPAPVPPGVNAPFSMEQYALAMLRVASRPDHVGQLDSRQPEALRIMCGFGSTFRRRSAPDVFRTLTATFHHAHALPVCLAESRAPPPPPGKHRALMDLVCEGFRKGRFGKGPSGYGVPPDWEERARALLRDDDVARFLYGIAMPLDDIAADLATAIDRTLATEAQGWAGADPTATALEPRSTPVTAEPQAAEAALERCVYVAVRGFSRGAVADAFAQVQERADGGGGATHVAKDELHITLWHAADGGQRRGLACVAAEGTPVRFTVTGFDVTPGLSAARVVFAPGAEAGTTGAPGVGALAGDVLAVELPHITMHVGRGEKAVNARWLQQRHARGEASVQWLPLQEPLLLTGKIHVVYK